MGTVASTWNTSRVHGNWRTLLIQFLHRAQTVHEQLNIAANVLPCALVPGSLRVELQLDITDNPEWTADRNENISIHRQYTASQIFALCLAKQKLRAHNGERQSRARAVGFPTGRPLLSRDS